MMLMKFSFVSSYAKMSSTTFLNFDFEISLTFFHYPWRHSSFTFLETVYEEWMSNQKCPHIDTGWCRSVGCPAQAKMVPTERDGAEEKASALLVVIS
jgi:hypothetical protein